jgi:hypothetical protein
VSKSNAFIQKNSAGRSEFSILWKLECVYLDIKEFCIRSKPGDHGEDHSSELAFEL